MTDLLAMCTTVLHDAGFLVVRGSSADRDIVKFENETVLGFIFAYERTEQLIEQWTHDVDRAIAAHQFGLRRAAQKAWNTYAILLASSPADADVAVTLSAIEEDLEGMRKIARGGVADVVEVRAALLPLLPLQSAPQLEAVDIVAEIRQRTTELPPRAVEAFLSTADDAVVLQVLEEAP